MVVVSLCMKIIGHVITTEIIKIELPNKISCLEIFEQENSLQFLKVLVSRLVEGPTLAEIMYKIFKINLISDFKLYF